MGLETPTLLHEIQVKGFMFAQSRFWPGDTPNVDANCLKYATRSDALEVDFPHSLPLMMSMVTPNPTVLPALWSLAEGVHFPTNTLWMEGMEPEGVVQNHREVLNARVGSLATWSGFARMLYPTELLAAP